jgi:hypothetical protein
MCRLAYATEIYLLNFKKKNMERAWYVFIDGDPFNCKNYRRLIVKPTVFFCGDRISAINAPNNGDYPAPFSSNLVKYIKEGLETQLFQPQKPLYTRPYLYLRD